MYHYYITLVMKKFLFVLKLKSNRFAFKANLYLRIPSSFCFPLVYLDELDQRSGYLKCSYVKELKGILNEIIFGVSP